MILASRGEGALALVLLHGLPHHPDAMWPFAARVDGVRVINVHLPGYAGSPDPALPYDWDAVAAEIEAALLEAHDGPFVLLGANSGCYRTMQLALRGRLDLRGLVWMGPTDGLATVVERASFRGMAAVLNAPFSLAYPLMTRAFTTATIEARPELKAETQRWLDAASPAVMASELRSFVDCPLLRDRLHAIDVPVLIRVGALDVATPPAVAQALHAVLPRAELQVVPGRAHALQIEDAAATGDAVAAFVARLRDEAAA